MTQAVNTCLETHTRGSKFALFLRCISSLTVMRKLHSRHTLGILSNSDDNVDLKMNLYFTYESCVTVKSFSFKTISNLNMEHTVNFEMKILKIIRHAMVHVFRTTQNLVISRRFFFKRGRQNRHESRSITHVHSDCIAH